MIYIVKLITSFIKASVQGELAYRENSYISILNSLINLVTGFLGIFVLFNQIDTIKGWNFASTLAILGCYLIISAIRDLFIAPSLDAISGLGGDIWSGKYDFTLLRPINSQWIVSFQKWHIYSLFDLILGTAVVIIAIIQMQTTLSVLQTATFLLMILVSLCTFYSILLLFTSFVFFSPGFQFTWVFNGIFQMARYPISIYPGWLKSILTWVIPIGLITTVPAEAISGSITRFQIISSILFMFALFLIATTIFQKAEKRYTSASS